MKLEDLPHPGYSASWGSTSQWKRKPEGPFVAYTYTSPNADGIASRSELFADSFAEAERIGLAWVDLLKRIAEGV